VTRFACILLCVTLVGCKAFRLPPVPDHPASAAASSLGVARIGWVRSDDGGTPPPQHRGEFLTRLRDDLMATRLFTRVVLDASAPADVVVDATYDTRSCSMNSLMMVLTLGLVPDVGCYRSGYQLTLTGNALPRGPIVVDNRSQPVLLIGWIAGPTSLLPGWSSSLPRAEEGEALRAAILAAIATADGEATSSETR
jgi:hypothetical protein